MKKSSYKKVKYLIEVKYLNNAQKKKGLKVNNI